MEQTERIEAARKGQTRRRVALAGAGGLAFALVVGAIVVLFPRPGTAQAQGHQVPIEGNRQHVSQSTDTGYRNRPPSSGDHYDTPSGYGVIGRQLMAGNLVHTLEHGGVIVYYRPDLCDQSCVAQLQHAFNAAPKSRQWGTVKMVVTPWQDMDHAVTAAAWGWVDEMDEADPARIDAFYQAHVDRGPEDAL
jgi:hypothetical protein